MKNLGNKVRIKTGLLTLKKTWPLGAWIFLLTVRAACGGSFMDAFTNIVNAENTVSIAESVGERWLQSAGNALFSAQNGLKMHADMR